MHARTVLRLATPLLLLLPIALMPHAVAAANGCATNHPGGAVTTTPTLVPFPFTSTLGGSCPSPPGGVPFSSSAATCPASPTTSAVPGAYCGGIGSVPLGAYYTCQIRGGTVTATALVVGLDLDGDGNIGIGLREPVAYAYGATASVEVYNNAGISTGAARVIAYPIVAQEDLLTPGFILVACDVSYGQPDG